MLINFLDKKTFNVRDFCNELDKKELLFLIFLNSQEADSIDILAKLNLNPHDLGEIAQSAVGKKYKKLIKEESINSLVEELESSKIGEWGYKELYTSAYDDDYIHFNSKIFMLERFIKMTMMKKIEQLQALLVTKKNQIFSEELKKILFFNKPIFNTLNLVLLIGKTDKLFEDFDSPTIKEFYNELLFTLLEQFEEINIKENEKLQASIKRKEIHFQKIQDSNKKKDEALAKNKELIKQLNAEVKALNSQLKEFSNKKENEDIEKYLKLIEVKDLELLEYKKKSETLKVEFEKYKENYSLQVEELALLKAEEKDKQMMINEYRRKIESFESKTLETYLDEYIEKEGFTQRLADKIEPMLKKYRHDSQKAQESQKRIEEQESLERKRIEQKIGYAVIEDNKHFVKFIDGSKLEIKGIPESVYIGKYQFVKVLMDGTFKWVYNFTYEQYDRDYQIAKFGSVVYKNNEPHIMVSPSEINRIERKPHHIQLRDNQVVSVNKNMELIRFYKGVQLNADVFMDSIKAKGHEALYILKIFPNGMLLRNIVSNEESFSVISTEGERIGEQEIIIVKDNNLIRKYISSKFYTLSSYYKYAQHGVAQIKDDTVFIKKLSGEMVIVNEIPSSINIQDGDLLVVDEFYNFIKVKQDFDSLDNTAERKKLLSITKSHNPRKGSLEKIELKKEVLIVGKTTYENSYKMALYKKGYKAEVIDGYEPWIKVKSAMKGKDFIVVVTEFVSHETSWAIKDEEVENPIIFSEFDGANRIVEQVEVLDNTGVLL